MVLVADRRLSTLRAYSDGRAHRAEDGARGGSNQRHGASGHDLTLRVPVGSVVWSADEQGRGTGAQDEVLADLATDGAAVTVARGGLGGRGNKRFTTSVRRAPQFAQSGEAGEHRRLRVELKLLADVGLIGLPNAGKSTLLRAWSRATPKVAPYPFTTLEPELGVVSVDHDGFVAADMPGLIEGASSGAGLGHEFLRHIERTRVLVHVIDMTGDDPLAARALIDAELEAFGHGLAEKPQLLALNKIDDGDAPAHVELLTEGREGRLPAAWGDTPWLEVSALTGEGAGALARRALQLLRQTMEAEEVATEPVVLRPEPRRRRFVVRREDDGRVVIEGRSVERWAATLHLADVEPRRELFDRLRRMGVMRAVKRQGVEAGDLVRIGEIDLRWEE